MASLIAPVIGIGASLLGGGSSKSGANKAAGLDLTGFNYLTKDGGAPTINAAQSAGMTAQQGATDTQNIQAELLGTKPVTDSTKNAFNNYLGSTGYQFQLDQGSRAITGSAAAKGMLNSGATAKALTRYGQDLGSSYFNNYLGQLGNLNSQQFNTAGQGINATVSTGSAGTQGGMAAGDNIMKGADAMGNAIGTAGGIAAGAISNNAGSINNWLGNL